MEVVDFQGGHAGDYEPCGVGTTENAERLMTVGTNKMKEMMKVVAAVAGFAVLAGCTGVVAALEQNEGKVQKKVLALKEKDIVPAEVAKRGHELGMFAGGCFWCTEGVFRSIPGVIGTAVGYAGGHTKNPTYKEVCTDKTGHAEAVIVEFDPKVISYSELVGKFWQMHDPTTLNRQGPDIGSQYRSVIFYFNEAQKAAALASIEAEQENRTSKIVTEVVPAPKFYFAEEYHQQYNEKKGIGAACEIR